MRNGLLLAGALGVMAAGLVGVVLVSTLADVPPPDPQPVTQPAPPPPMRAEHNAAPEVQEAPPPQAPAPAPAEDTPSPVDVPTVAAPRFTAQAEDDRRRLGDAVYKELDALWTKGRVDSSPAANAALTRILERFPDTHRAGCARLQLGLHTLKDPALPVADRVKAASPLLETARTRDVETRCDGDVSAGRMAQLALAADVYRTSDPRLAASLLAELAALPDSEVDHLGRPLNEKARALAQRPAPPSP